MNHEIYNKVAQRCSKYVIQKLLAYPQLMHIGTRNLAYSRNEFQYNKLSLNQHLRTVITIEPFLIFQLHSHLLHE